MVRGEKERVVECFEVWFRVPVGASKSPDPNLGEKGECMEGGLVSLLWTLTDSISVPWRSTLAVMRVPWYEAKPTACVSLCPVS